MPNKEQLESDQLLNDLLADAEAYEKKIQARAVRKFASTSRKGAAKSPNALKRRVIPNDDPVRKLAAKPSKIVIYWTTIKCACGEVYQKPTYENYAFLYWPNKDKKGVAEFVPLQSYNHYPHLPREVVWHNETITLCPCCMGRHTSVALLPPPMVQRPPPTPPLNHPTHTAEEAYEYADLADTLSEGD
jgi:hypothetical protein